MDLVMPIYGCKLLLILEYLLFSVNLNGLSKGATFGAFKKIIYNKSGFNLSICCFLGLQTSAVSPKQS